MVSFGGLFTSRILPSCAAMTAGTLRRRPDGVRVTVTDTNTDPPTSREPDEDAESGRGLALINGVAEHFGTVIRRDSKDVWAEILISRPAALA